MEDPSCKSIFQTGTFPRHKSARREGCGTCLHIGREPPGASSAFTHISHPPQQTCKVETVTSLTKEETEAQSLRGLYEATRAARGQAELWTWALMALKPVSLHCLPSPRKDCKILAEFKGFRICPSAATSFVRRWAEKRIQV